MFIKFDYIIVNLNFISVYSHKMSEFSFNLYFCFLEIYIPFLLLIRLALVVLGAREVPVNQINRTSIAQSFHNFIINVYYYNFIHSFTFYRMCSFQSRINFRSIII